MAQTIYNKLTPFKSSSAGTQVIIKNQKISERPLAKPVIKFMKKEGVDISQNTSNQVTQKMLNGFDKIIVMAEPETIPSFLLKNKKTEIWTIEDPSGKNDDDYKRIISQIKTKIKELIKK